MEDLNFRKGDAKTEVFGSNRMLQPSPVEKIPDGPTTPEIAYQMVKDETFAQTQPRLNLATFVTTYMDEYATKLMNEAININYCLLYTSPSPRDRSLSRMPSSA